MSESITLKRDKPTLQSMDYAFLKALGIQRLQELAGKIWTDYNEHDPGVTILDALCYAITDLGYRTSFDMKDLLTADPTIASEEYNDFHTAREILHNLPLTIKDYRKLLMDVSVLAESNDPESEIIGIKNAWLRVAQTNEHPIYVNSSETQLQYQPDKTGSSDPLDLSLLYEVILEFTDSQTFGDLNTDLHEGSFDALHPEVVAFLLGEPLAEPIPTEKYDDDILAELQGLSPQELDNLRSQTRELLDLRVVAQIEFPRWDDLEVDWQDIQRIKANTQSVKLTFLGLPSYHKIRYKLDEDKDILLASGKEALKDRPVPLLDYITTRLNCLVMGPKDSLIASYQKRVLKILEIVAKAKARLMANRNLCEDFYKFSALRVEEILICADIEVEAEADVVEVESRIYFEIDKFLSPTVNFYDIQEIRALDQQTRKYDIQTVDKDRKVIVVPTKLRQVLTEGDTITLSGFGPDNLPFTVTKVTVNALESDFTDIEVLEDLSQLQAKESAFLYVGELDEEDLRPVEEVMLGPALNNGFIDDDELQFADLRDELRASDLINLIMDVPGVKTIRTLEMANRPQNENSDIESRSVRWCLKLAVDQNYIPKLSLDGSGITFLKDSLPIGTDQIKVSNRFEELKAAERPRIRRHPQLDFAVPRGEYRELKNYTSIQRDFPLIYGVGPEGLPQGGLDGDELQMRLEQVKQLKGFLTIFDQVMANYLAQLENFKGLFSFNPTIKSQRDSGDVLPEEYNFEVNKTYFSEPIYDEVPNGHELYEELHGVPDAGIDAAKVLHGDELQKLTEDIGTFSRRRNRFLDHLMARYAEQVADYSLLATRLDGPNADLELIEDKQDFLSRYPELSSERGTGFDYKSPYYWDFDNMSGLAKRVAFLGGIDPRPLEALAFSPSLVDIQASGDQFQWSIIDGGDTLLDHERAHADLVSLNLEIEKLILCGTCSENYHWKCKKVEGQNRFSLYLSCTGQLLGTRKDAFATVTEVRDAIDRLVELFEQELLNNPLANRRNLSLPLDNYLIHEEITDSSVDEANRSYTVPFALHASPNDFTEGTRIMQGTLAEQSSSIDIDSVEDLKAEATRRIRERFWELAFFGVAENRIAVDNNDVVISDRFGEQIASGTVTKINQVLEDRAPEGGTPEQSAVDRLRVFLTETFFQQEGLHVLEHILLRPKVNGLWVPVTSDNLLGIPQQTSLIPFDEPLSNDFILKGSQLVVEGDITSKVLLNSKLTVVMGSRSTTLQVASIEFQEGRTIIEGTRSGPARKRRLTDNLDSIGIQPVRQTLFVQRNYQVLDIDLDQLRVLIQDSAAIVEGDVFSIYDADLKTNFGTFRASGNVAEGDDTWVSLQAFMVQDALLPIHYPKPTQDHATDSELSDSKDETPDPEAVGDCDSCQVTDPYSHIAHVVVAGWPGRFNDIDFRSFFERSLRKEAPAHVFLNICWVGPLQMEEFEMKYKKWLMLNVKPFPPAPFDAPGERDLLRALSKAQNELVKVLDELRNVYPVRSLHDCEDGEGTEGAIILDQTALGEI